MYLYNIREGNPWSHRVRYLILIGEQNILEDKIEHSQLSHSSETREARRQLSEWC